MIDGKKKGLLGESPEQVVELIFKTYALYHYRKISVELENLIISFGKANDTFFKAFLKELVRLYRSYSAYPLGTLFRIRIVLFIALVVLLASCHF